MATMTMNLSEKDLHEAIDAWLSLRGLTTASPPRITATPGDRPGECTTFTASVQVKDHPDNHR